MDKHTKGHWHAEIATTVGGDEQWIVRRDDDDVAIASGIIDPETFYPSEAYARLMAAAPKFRDALEQIRAIIESDSELPYKQVNQINKIVCEALEVGDD